MTLKSNCSVMALAIVGASSIIATAADSVSFVDDVQPILVSKCISCHGPEKQEGGLRLDSPAAARAGGQQGAAIVPSDVAKSLLITAISFRDPNLQMPPKQKLSDKEIETLTEWVKSGARWPEPIVVLFEDEPQFLTVLTNGNGQARLVNDGRYSGQAALRVTPLQRESPKIPHWNFAIREKPTTGEYRYLRLAWRKQGAGSVMLELAADGKWPDAKVAKGRYVAGPNTTGWAAISVSDVAPQEWTVTTFDLWQDIGNFTLTGCAPTCDRGDAAFFDALLLGPTLESLDVYRVGSPLVRRPDSSVSSQNGAENIGDAFTDRRNPIRKLFGGERLDLWSLKPPRGTSLEEQSASERLDEIVHEQLQKERLKLAPNADARTLIRRLTFDLTGLPPTPEDVAAFIKESSGTQFDAAYRRLVDSLLASPRYGERQARLWLDVVRYADTNGYERDEFRPLIWQYRDYVIRSFNSDKPFHQFIREQLAGDELLLERQHATRPQSDDANKPAADSSPSVNQPPSTPSTDADLLIATGFLRLGQWDSTASIFQEEPRLRAEMMADVTNTTASAFLGLTMSCCQCHDHKYDPLSQVDHFRLRAFFAGLQDKNDTVISSAAELAEIKRHNDGLAAQADIFKQQQITLLDPVRKQITNERLSKLSEDIRKVLATDQSQWDDATKKKLQPVLDQLKVSDQDARAALTEPAKTRDAELSQQINSLNSQKREPQRAMTAHDSGSTAPATHLFYQGDFAAPREEVLPGFPSLFAPGPASIVIPVANTTGRRLALANWIVSPQNPFTARVIVNRIWQQHFGTGLVATPNDFGHSGARPSNQQLLDTLAVDFMQRGWSIKKLHRTIVLSATYRQATHLGTTTTRDGATHGPDRAVTQVAFANPPFRPSLRRLDAEMFRDALLSVSGLLKPYGSGKPLWPPVPNELLKAQPAILEAEKGGDGGRLQGWYENPLEETDVRSIFLIRKRCLPIPFLQAFDLPDTTVSCARRDSTVVAPQALMLLNSAEGIRYAQALADRIAPRDKPLAFHDTERTAALVESLFQRTLTRSATAEEHSLATDLLRRHQVAHAKQFPAESSAHRAVTDLCRAVMNLNEFAYID